MTGAGSGIGRAVATRLAEAGATVCVSSRSEEHVRSTCEAVERNAGTDAMGFVTDVTNQDAVDRLIEDVTVQVP